jgi:hypothetical protein
VFGPSALANFTVLAIISSSPSSQYRAIYSSMSQLEHPQPKRWDSLVRFTFTLLKLVSWPVATGLWLYVGTRLFNESPGTTADELAAILMIAIYLSAVWDFLKLSSPRSLRRAFGSADR